ncbi:MULTISPECIES: 2OG-Fe(II) oxygenase family protein [Salinivibrio]|uniref:2-oxoglutarate-dependent ethylene/succinate-forming enzyme n=2 Tax=Salinivibrio TaxID=51366 RepID=A0AA47KP74_9GAMM|nr:MULTISPECIES: 2OG-Fe(II) oxygenase family protein [Salinivibrio]KKA43558.1 2OG-Fe(II) oxygenase [Salinivibrio sp. KP-1]MPS30935.1 isopenicillin N synthase family oxygenase [Salinivibrio sp. VYel7]MPX89524.1 isopenicillin N synthase family oxygenase [Salinivibrio sp. VYel1]MPX92336.1 isopenicillin N synthase family oxygenase [Salinivibrio sp. VYel9]MPX97088.1 isopenicillin N synthase family oxygenase [Salinivibrio sp. VYel6]
MTLQAIDFTAPDAEQAFVKSLRETGFGVLKNHPLQQQWVADIYQQWEGFFNTEDKHRFTYKPDTQDGFFPSKVAETAKGHTKRDLKEFFHYYPWGQCPDALRGNLQSYYEHATHLAETLLSWVERQSPSDISQHFSQPLSSMINGSQQTLLRVLHYPPLKGDEELGAIRAAAHEDINLLTILPAANEPGLQVKAKDGSWLDVPCDFGNLIVNIGDMLQEASGGYFPSTTHRVVNPEGADKTKARISLPLFLHPKPDVVLSERHTANSYLMERLRELGVIE